MDDALAELMDLVWAGFQPNGSRRGVDRRTQGAILAYIEALRSESDQRKTFKGLARILQETPGASVRNAEQLQRLITDRDWDWDAVLEAAAIALTPRLIPEALILRNVNTTRLGEHLYRANDGRPPQRAMLLALAARIPDGETTLLILRWRLAIERGLWGTRNGGREDDAFSRFKVPYGAERLPLAGIGTKAIADARRWPELDLPIVGGATFSGVRARWRRAGVPYIVEWIPPGTASLLKILRSNPSIRSVRVANVDGTPLHEMFIVEHNDGREVIIRMNAPRGHRTSRAVRTWCTNMFDGDPDGRSIRRALELGNLRFLLQPTYQQLRERYGLNDYQGISYDGWHRHAALVALAHSSMIFAATRDER